MKIYPKNKEYFKRLVPFAKKIILILNKNKIKSVIYGSFAHFFHTKDQKMNVHDIDIIIDKKNFGKVCKALENNHIKFKYYTDWSTLIIKNNKLKVEIDSLYGGYPKLKEGKLPHKYLKVDFYGLGVNLLRLEDLEEIYPVAYKRSNDNKIKIMKKIKHLEKFLGRKLK